MSKGSSFSDVAFSIVIGVVAALMVFSISMNAKLLHDIQELKKENQELRKQLNETKYWLTMEQKISNAIAEDRQMWMNLYWDAQNKLWLESECLNGTIKQYIDELERMNDEAMTVNTLALFYAYNSTINKTLLYRLDPDAEQHEKLLKKWGFEVR